MGRLSRRGFLGALGALVGAVAAGGRGLLAEAEAYGVPLPDGWRSGVIQSWSITFDDGSPPLMFSGYITNFAPMTDAEGNLGAYCTVRVAGAPVAVGHGAFAELAEIPEPPPLRLVANRLVAADDEDGDYYLPGLRRGPVAFSFNWDPTRAGRAEGWE